MASFEDRRPNVEKPDRPLSPIRWSDREVAGGRPSLDRVTARPEEAYNGLAMTVPRSAPPAPASPSANSSAPPAHMKRLDDLNAKALLGGGEDRIKKQHESGKLTDRKSVV